MKYDPKRTARRTFIKGAAITGASTTGFASITAARGSDDQSNDVTAESQGINEEVRNLLDEQKFEKASKLLEKHGVLHAYRDLSFDPESSDLTSAPATSTEGPTVEGGPTGGVFNKSESEIDFFMYHLSGDLFSVEIVFDHKSKPFDTDCIAPNDLLAVTFDGARWQYEPGSQNVVSGDLRHFDSRNDGVKIEWYYDAYPATGETSGHFVTLLRKADNYDGDPSNVWAHYKHVYTPWYKLGCYNGLLGTNISLSPGVIGISFDASDWEKNTVQSL